MKGKLMKKFLSVLLLLSMTLTLLISCDATDDPLEVTEPVEESGTEAPTEKATQKKKETEEKKPMTGASTDNTLKILAIGNSFSDDTMQYVYQIAKSSGVENIKLGNLYIGGCSLDLHSTNASYDKAAYDYRTNYNGTWNNTPNTKMSDALLSENWDYVTLQQASGSSGIVDTYATLEYMIDYVKSLAPDAEIFWNMTWAYQQNSTHGEFPKYNSDQKTMYDAIVSAVKSRVCTNENIAGVITNGTAIQNARTSYVGDKLTRDGFHLSLDLGRYIAGLNLFYKITGISIENIEFMPDGVDPDLQKVAIESVLNANILPFEISYSDYTEPPVFDESNYTKLDLGLTMLAYWNSSAGTGLDTRSDNHIYFAATRTFTKEDIPVGSVIIIADGWKYRPDAWKAEAPHGSRPDNVTTQKVVVTEQWWNEYVLKGFNISRTDNGSLEGLSAADIEAIFTIYVPKA